MTYRSIPHIKRWLTVYMTAFLVLLFILHMCLAAIGNADLRPWALS